jgi:NhaA family Na+:H+ antiporter
VPHDFEGKRRSDARKGLLLAGAVVVALILANSPIADRFAPLWSGPFHYFVNHGAMALFFLLVGLELKRALLSGELHAHSGAALPVAAALGGAIVPALLYLAVAGRPNARGWGVPMSTDTAFAIGVLGLLGHRAPARLRLFLAAFAILDDIVAVLVIAVFYTEGISFSALALAGFFLALLAVFELCHVKRLAPYLLVGTAVWAALLPSGIHASVAGIFVAAFIPGGGPRSPLNRLEHLLDPWVTWVVLPLFALSNGGIAVAGSVGDLMRHRAALGIALGLLVGKPLGVLAGCGAVLKLRLARMPRGMRFRHIAGVAALSGIGFTMAIFIATLAFDGAVLSLDEAKLAVLGASLLAALSGAAILGIRPSHRPWHAAPMFGGRVRSPEAV